MRDTKKMLRSKIVDLRKIYKFCFDHFLVKRTVFALSVKNCFYKIKESIFQPNYATYDKSVKEQNCLFQKDLRILFWPFFGKTHGFCFIRQELFLQNQRIHFPAKLCDIRQKC